MEQKRMIEPFWRLWVDPHSRAVSFYAVEGFQPLEFRNLELFLACVDQYTAQQYRYQ